MQQSRPSVPPPEYTRQDPARSTATPSTPSTLLSSSRTPSSQVNPRNVQSQAQTQPQSQSTPVTEHYAPTSATSTTKDPDYARPPSPTPSTQTTASTILPSYADTGSYKGFPSEAAYIAALTEWAEHKKYVQPSEEAQTLSGFFGYKTMEDYTGPRTPRDAARTRRKSSQGQGQRGGFVGFFKNLAKKDEGGGHAD
ncbi:unnamed protein product [Aureobasidium mustum]|uniref:Uncharacterized protein n=1 Tax=Aureobasidium mustum TaxID=2773714 RepID=A0A9N8PL84_9PEZI|nr:unnamed protein product [Aureobasidium mustum]